MSVPANGADDAGLYYGERSPSVRALISRSLNKDDAMKVGDGEGKRAGRMSWGRNSRRKLAKGEKKKKKERRDPSPASGDKKSELGKDGPFAREEKQLAQSAIERISNGSAASEAAGGSELHRAASASSTTKGKKQQLWQEFLLKAQDKEDQAANLQKDFLLADLNAWLESSTLSFRCKKGADNDDDLDGDEEEDEMGKKKKKRNSINYCDSGVAKGDGGGSSSSKKKQGGMEQRRASSQRQLMSVTKLPPFKSQNTLRKLRTPTDGDTIDNGIEDPSSGDREPGSPEPFSSTPSSSAPTTPTSPTTPASPDGKGRKSRQKGSRRKSHDKTRKDISSNTSEKEKGKGKDRGKTKEKDKDKRKDKDKETNNERKENGRKEKDEKEKDKDSKKKTHRHKRAGSTGNVPSKAVPLLKDPRLKRPRLKSKSNTTGGDVRASPSPSPKHKNN